MKVTELTTITSLTTDDLVYVIDDPGGTPASKKCAISSVLNLAFGGTNTWTGSNTFSGAGITVGIAHTGGTDPNYNLLSITANSHNIFSAGASGYSGAQGTFRFGAATGAYLDLSTDFTLPGAAWFLTPGTLRLSGQQGVNIAAGGQRITVGYYYNEYPGTHVMDGTLSVSSGITVGDTVSWTMSEVTDAANPAVTALSISPSQTSRRIFFGNSTNQVYALNFAYVTALEQTPSIGLNDGLSLGNANAGIGVCRQSVTDAMLFTGGTPETGGFKWYAGNTYSGYAVDQTMIMELTKAGGLGIGGSPTNATGWNGPVAHIQGVNPHVRLSNSVNGNQGYVGFDNNLHICAVSTASSIFLRTQDTARWQITPDGHLYAYNADNTYDIGASGASRPRNVYVAGTLSVGKAILKTASWGSSSFTLYNSSLADTASNHALWQDSDGNTGVNAASGSSLFFRVNNATVQQISSTGTAITGTATFTNTSGSGLAEIKGSGSASYTSSLRLTTHYGNYWDVKQLSPADSNSKALSFAYDGSEKLSVSTAGTFTFNSYSSGPIKIRATDGAGIFTDGTAQSALTFTYYSDGSEKGAIYVNNSGVFMIKSNLGGYISPGNGVSIYAPSAAITCYSATGLKVRNLADTADAPFTASTGTFSSTLTSTTQVDVGSSKVQIRPDYTRLIGPNSPYGNYSYLIDVSAATPTKLVFANIFGNVANTAGAWPIVVAVDSGRMLVNTVTDDGSTSLQVNGTASFAGNITLTDTSYTIVSGTASIRPGGVNAQWVAPDTLSIAGGNQRITFGGTGAYCRWGSNVAIDFVDNAVSPTAGQSIWAKELKNRWGILDLQSTSDQIRFNYNGTNNLGSTSISVTSSNAYIYQYDSTGNSNLIQVLSPTGNRFALSGTTVWRNSSGTDITQVDTSGNIVTSAKIAVGLTAAKNPVVDILTGNNGTYLVDDSTCMRLRSNATDGNCMAVTMGVGTGINWGGAGQGFAYIQPCYWGGGYNNPLVLCPLEGQVVVGPSMAKSTWAVSISGTLGIHSTSNGNSGALAGKIAFSPSGYVGENAFIAGIYDGAAFYNGQGLVFYTNYGADVAAGDSATEKFRIGSKGNFWVWSTNTAAGTTGAQTIDKASGTVNFAAGASTLVVTNALVTTSSIVFASVRTNDSTAQIKNVVPASGSFTITLSAAATAETSVGFFVIN